jgi:GNAT superfamily N-acetyltransferase
VIRVLPLSETLVDAWSALFVAAHCPCYCRFWHFAGDKNAWLDRCANAKEENQREHALAVQRGDPDATGLVAMEGGEAVGWMKLVPRASVPKLRNQSVYRALDLGEDEGVWSIGCFLIHPAHRRRGVARALVRASFDFVRERGGRAVEAYPRRSGEPMHDEEAWLGPESVFSDFEIVAGEAPYPVYRKAIQ